MIVTQSRGSLRDVNINAMEWNIYYSYPVYHVSQCADPVGKSQTVTGWRSKVRPSKYEALRNPHPCNLNLVVSSSDVVDGLKPWQMKQPYGWTRIYGNVAQYYANRANFPQHFKPLGDLTSLETRMIDRAIVSVYSKMKSPKFDGLTNLGELKETIKGILNPMSGVKGILKKLTKKPVRSYRKKSSSNTYMAHVNSQWLEYRYSLMPLVLTIQDGLKAATWKLQGSGYMTQVTHSGERVRYPEVMSIHNGVDFYIPVKFILKTESDVRVGASIASQLNINEQNFWGLSLMDIPSTAWELVPLSFVGDWFFNVGDWIRAVTPDPTRRILSSSVSIRRSRITTLDITHFQADEKAKTWQTVNKGGNATYLQQNLARYTNPDLPLLPVYDDKSLSWMRQLDAFALSYKGIKNSINKLLRK